MASDAVTLPQHYARFKIEPIRFMVENFGAGVLVSKIIKYTVRYDAKNGLEDLNKAKRCCEMLIKFIEGDEDWWKKPPEVERGELHAAIVQASIASEQRAESHGEQADRILDFLMAGGFLKGVS